MADPRDCNLGYFNREAAAAHGDRRAIVDLSRTPPKEIAHGELDARMDRVAAALCARDLAPGDRVLLAMANRSEFVEAFFGTMRAGLVPVPLNIRLGADTIRFVIGDSSCRAAIVSPGAHPEIEAIAEAARLAPRIATAPSPSGWDDYEAALAEADPSGFAPPPIAARQAAFLPYTSGSTGRPKGVPLAHDGMLWAIRSSQLHWPAAPDYRALIAGPLYHKNAMRVSVKPKLHVGASVVVLPRFEPRLFLRALSEYRCTEAGGVPAMYRMMLAEWDLLQSLDFSSLETLEMGSAVVGAELIAAVEQRHGRDAGARHRAGAGQGTDRAEEPRLQHAPPGAVGAPRGGGGAVTVFRTGVRAGYEFRHQINRSGATERQNPETGSRPLPRFGLIWAFFEVPIWDDMRKKFFANIVLESMDAVENKISEAYLHYEEHTETVRSITAFPWIADNLSLLSG